MFETKLSYFPSFAMAILSKPQGQAVFVIDFEQYQRWRILGANLTT